MMRARSLSLERRYTPYERSLSPGGSRTTNPPSVSDQDAFFNKCKYHFNRLHHFNDSNSVFKVGKDKEVYVVHRSHADQSFAFLFGMSYFLFIRVFYLYRISDKAGLHDLLQWHTDRFRYVERATGQPVDVWRIATRDIDVNEVLPLRSDFYGQGPKMPYEDKATIYLLDGSGEYYIITYFPVSRK